jgi:hypothetical protein
MAYTNLSETTVPDFYSERGPNESDHSELSESDKHGVEIARYDMVFRITDASLLHDDNAEDENFNDGSVTFKRFSQNKDLLSVAEGALTTQAGPLDTYRAYLVYETLRATYSESSMSVLLCFQE